MCEDYKCNTRSDKISNGVKKTILIVLALVIFSNFHAYAFESKLPAKRSDIFEESKKIKAILTTSRDVILVNSMWDSCIFTMAQLDAYFVMVSIFNTIKQKDARDKSADYLMTWLKEIQKTNDVNIKSLSAVSFSLKPDTEILRASLKVYYKKLNEQISKEMKAVSLLKKSFNIR